MTDDVIWEIIRGERWWIGEEVKSAVRRLLYKKDDLDNANRELSDELIEERLKSASLQQVLDQEKLNSDAIRGSCDILEKANNEMTNRNKILERALNSIKEWVESVEEEE